MILYPPNITTVTPIASPPAIKNCGDARSANTAGDEAFRPVRMEGDILVSRLEISASVRATAAMASGLAWRFVMIAVAEWCRHCASSRRVSSFDIVAASSISLSVVFWGRRSGGRLP